MSAPRPDHERRQAREHLRAGLLVQGGKLAASARRGLVRLAGQLMGMCLVVSLTAALVTGVGVELMLFFCFSVAGLDQWIGGGSKGDGLTQWAYDPRAQALALALFVALPALTALVCALWERASPAPKGLGRAGELAEGLRWSWIPESDRRVRSAARRALSWGDEVFVGVDKGGASRGADPVVVGGVKLAGGRGLRRLLYGAGWAAGCGGQAMGGSRRTQKQKRAGAGKKRGRSSEALGSQRPAKVGRGGEATRARGSELRGVSDPASARAEQERSPEP